MRRRAMVEPLEQRLLLRTTLFMDFGLGVGMGNTLSTDVATFRDIFGAGIHGGDGTGSDMTSAGMAGGDSLDFTPLAYDFNLDGTTDDADIAAMGNAIVPIAQRALEPFDIDVVIASATSVADAIATVGANAGDPTGEFDSYCFVMDCNSDAFGGGSVGDWFYDATGLYGIAAADDLFFQGGNTQDEAILAFSDELFDATTGTAGTAQFNENLVHRIAYTATHEAFHTLTYVHTINLTSSGDVIRYGSVTREDPFIVTRFDLARQGGYVVAEPNNYLQAANDPDIGLRDDDGDGVPNLAYVTGTGAHDRITLTSTGLNTVDVLVEAFSDSGHTTLITSELYNIGLTVDTEGEILIDASINNDEVIIDPAINATFRIRGGSGVDGVATENDVVIVQGDGSQVGTYTPSPTESDAGTISVAGGAQIVFDELEPVTVSGFFEFTFITPNSNDVLAVDSPGAGQNRVFGTSGGVAFESLTFSNVAHFKIDTAANDAPLADPNDTVTFSSDLVATGLSSFTVDLGEGNDEADATNVTSLGVTLLGGPGDDTLIGGDGDEDRLEGGPGQDRLVGRGGRNTLLGGEDSDLIAVTTSFYNIVDGGAGSDHLNVRGPEGDYTISRVADFPIVGVSGPSIYVSAADVEEINVAGDFAGPATTSSLSIGDLTGTTVTQVGAGWFLDGGGGGLTQPMVGTLTVEGSPLDDAIAVTEGGFFATVPSSAMVTLGWGRVSFLPDDDGTLVIDGMEGNDTIKVEASAPMGAMAITLNGGAGDDYLSADATLIGGLGNDVLEGGSGNDTMAGDAGDDTFIGNGGTDTVTGGTGFDTILVPGTAGDDTISVAQAAGVHTVTINGVTTTYAAGSTFERMLVQAGEGNDRVTASGAVVGLVVEGGAGNDTVDASAATTSATLFGEAGNDALIAASGGGRLDGGHDDDTLVVNGGLTGALAVAGGDPSASDVLNLLGAPLTAETVTIAPDASNPTEQDITGLGAPIDVSGVELITYTGSPDVAGGPDDTLNFDPGAGDDQVRVDDQVDFTTARVTSGNLPEVHFTGLDTFFIESGDFGSVEATFVTAFLDPLTTYNFGGFGEDTLIIEGLPFADNFTVANVLGRAAVTDNVSGVTINDTVAASGDLQINGFGGMDLFTVTPLPATSVSIYGGDPIGTLQQPIGDVLNVETGGAAFLYEPGPEPDSGSVTVDTFRPVSFDEIELLQIQGVPYILPDEFDQPDVVFPTNDSIDSATVLGSLPKITLRDLTLHDEGAGNINEDYFQITAQDTGKLIFNVFFTDDFAANLGDVDIEVRDASGNFIDGSFSITDDEHVVIPVVGQQQYFLHVFSANGLPNIYDLEIENFQTPMPTGVTFDPNDDSGMRNDDLVTFVDNARLFVKADLAEFQAEGITILDAAQADAGDVAGAAVEVFVNGQSAGFASPFLGLSTLFEFTLDVTADADPDVGEWSQAIAISTGRGTPSARVVAADNAGYFNIVQAAVRIFDGQLDGEGLPAPATGRSQLSPELDVHFDPNAPDASLVTLDMLSASDTGADHTDNITSINQPAFTGVAEANTQIRLYATELDALGGSAIGPVELIGQDFVGSDSSDVGVAGASYIGLGGALGDGLGLWEITVEPLREGFYRITVEVEDLPGNVTDQEAGPSLDLQIDTLPPQRPTIDLVGPDVVDNDRLGFPPVYSDTGMSTMDNVTSGHTLIVGGDPDGSGADAAQVQVRVSAEAGSLVLIKDGEDVIDSFIMPVPGVGDPVDFVFRTLMLDEDPHPLSVEAFDLADNRSEQSEELQVTIDLTDPDPANVTLDLIDASDSFGPDGGVIGTNSDNVTNINQPAFEGIAEANAQVRVFGERVVLGVPTGVVELIGQGIVNSDQSDGNTTIDPPNTNVLGTWEVTVEPLIDGDYIIRVEVEDLAGNITLVNGDLPITVDTLPPQRPTIDLENPDDTGNSDLDNVTIGDPLLLPATGIADFRISAEPGSWVQVKDGEVVIAAFVFNPGFDLTDGVVDGFGVLTIDFNLNQIGFGIPSEGPHPLSVESFDVPGNRSDQSEELLVTVDTTAPAAPTAPDLLPDSDTGMFDNDNVTSKMSPAFRGFGEANAQIRIFAQNIVTGAFQLVGEGVVGSDESDLNPQDGLGMWEITIEPLDDGAYLVLGELEDLAGNISALSGELTMEIDTIQPNTSFLDLVEASDSGRHNDDNITNDDTPDVTLTTHDPNVDFHLLIPDLVNGGGLTDYLKFRIFDRFEETNEFLLYDSAQDAAVDNVLQPGDTLTNLTFVLETLPAQFFALVGANAAVEADGTLADGIHNLKLEVEDRAGNISHDFLLDILVDTVAPPVSIGLAGNAIDGIDPATTDTGVEGQPGTFVDRITSDTGTGFWGRAEADAIVRLYVDAVSNDAIGNPAQFGLTVALPEDGDDAFPDGQWRTPFIRDLNDPGFLPLDGLREVLVTAEDVAGNVNQVDDLDGDGDQILDIFIDTRGPQVNGVAIASDPVYDLFNPKGPDTPDEGPTPLVHALDIAFVDQPTRVNGALNFVYPAVNQILATQPGNYLLVGDANGVIPIQSIGFNDTTVAGGIGMTTVTLNFFDPLPDDRFTLTVFDRIKDDAGNALDGESNTIEPQDNPQFPTGDGDPGESFVGRFTVDSRPEIGVWSAGSVYVDTNGNFHFDPTNLDYTNRDITYLMGFASDDIFAGNFASLFDNLATPGVDERVADGFDKLAAYGHNTAGRYRWLVDTDNDGVADMTSVEPAGFNGLGKPVAGNFDVVNPNDPNDPGLLNGDEVGLFTGSSWLLDTDHDFLVSDEVPINPGLVGYPIVGDFDGDGQDDLATYLSGVFSFDLFANAGLGVEPVVPTVTLNFLQFIGTRERPVAADMNQDGIDDLGLWVPDRSGVLPETGGEWYFLISTPTLADPLANPAGTVDWLDHPFSPVPFGDDLFAQFGDEYAAPIVGNFDPPVAGSAAPAPDTLSLEGTDGDDTLKVTVNGPGQWTVDLNGIQLNVGAEIVALEFKGLEGKDSVVVTGSAGTEKVKLWPGRGTLTGEGYTVAISGSESITVRGGGGADVAVLYDNPAGKDAFRAYPEVARLFGDGYFNQVASFRYVNAVSTDGNEDTAGLYDDPNGDDVFKAWPDQARLYSESFYNRAVNFRHVTAFGTEGNKDVAAFFDNPEGNDVFKARPDLAELYGDGYYNRAKSFSYAQAVATEGNKDVAVLHDDPNGNDVFKAWPVLADLYGDGYYNRAKSFSYVQAVGTKGNKDVAVLYDSVGDDTFEAGPDQAKLFGDGYLNRAKSFGNVRAVSRAGGVDVAYLYGSAGDDRFVARSNFSKLSGDGFLNRAVSFEQVHAYAADGNDLAVLYDAVLEAGLTQQPVSAEIASIVWLYDIETIRERSEADGGTSTTDAVDAIFTAYWQQ
ncbi:MAG: Ig-like domain-containing protein [Planctomycetota bacterium]